MIFKQKAKLTTNYKGEIEENFYEWDFVVKLKGDTEKTSVIYDKKLKMYFENPSGVIYNYEVEFTDVKLNLCERLQKSENFNRKLFYRYDFIQPKVNSRGQVISIENKENIRQTWAALKAKMQTDHKGDYVEKYLQKIDLEFTSDELLYPVMNQYMYFGLLFLNIPKTHNKDWVGKRLVELSPFEKEKFEEISTVSSINEKETIYTIEGNTLQGSNTEVHKYAGYAIKAKDETFSRKIILNTSIKKDGILSEWDFTFYKII